MTVRIGANSLRCKTHRFLTRLRDGYFTENGQFLMGCKPGYRQFHRHQQDQTQFTRVLLRVALSEVRPEHDRRASPAEEHRHRIPENDNGREQCKRRPREVEVILQARRGCLKIAIFVIEPLEIPLRTPYSSVSM